MPFFDQILMEIFTWNLLMSLETKNSCFAWFFYEGGGRAVEGSKRWTEAAVRRGVEGGRRRTETAVISSKGHKLLLKKKLEV